MATRNSCLLEALERRCLMATVNVADFGALPGDGIDDRASIQNAINASLAGDTVSFGPGQFNVNGTINLRSDRQYLGNGTTLKGISTAHVAFLNHGSNVTISGFVFDGAGVKLEATSGVAFTQNTIENLGGDVWLGNGVYVAGSIAGSNITRNTFRNIGHRGIYFFSPTNTRFEDNLFENVYQPISGSNFAPSRNVSFSYNTLRGAKRHGIELQNYADSDNWLVEGNLISDWADGRPGWSSHMAISFAMGNSVINPDGTRRNVRSNGHIIRNNVLLADGAIPTMIAQGVPKYYFTAIEAMGNGFVIDNNHAEGWGWYQLVGVADANWITRNNTWLGTATMPVIPGIGSAAGQEIVPEDRWTGGPAQNAGNFYGRIGDRARPVAGVRDETPNPGSPLVPSLSASGGINVTLTIGNTNASGTTLIERRAGVGGWQVVALLSFDTVTYTDRAFAFDQRWNTWEFWYRATAVVDTQTSATTSEAHAQLSRPRLGDANFDGLVNQADFAILSSNFGATGAVWEQGDFTLNGTVDLDDFNVLASNFDAPPTPSAGTNGGRRLGKFK